MNIASQWKTELSQGGYEHHASRRTVRRLSRLSRLWRRVMRAIRLPKQGMRVFEVGCGGGIHLAQFALNGARCVGIDVSPEVLARAKNFMDELRAATGRGIPCELIEGDFMRFDAAEHLGQYDIVFHVGVVEHFLDDAERQAFLERMFSLCRPGGYVVSVVPSGMHPWRKIMKEQKLGGYNIPEIDYTPELMRKEFIACGAKDATVLPHNLFGYLTIKPGLARKCLFYAAQLVPVWLFPQKFAFRAAGTLIGIAQKP